jgi:hypothetical protein
VPLQGQVLQAQFFLTGQPDGHRLEAMLALAFPPALHAVGLGHGACSFLMGDTDTLL